MRLPACARLLIVSAVVLLSPVLAFLLAITAEIVIVWLSECGTPALIALAAAGAIGASHLRRVRERQRADPTDTA
jgi:hypothetical protein